MVVIYEMLSEQPPFWGENLLAISSAIQRDLRLLTEVRCAVNHAEHLHDLVEAAHGRPEGSQKGNEQRSHAGVDRISPCA